MHTPLAGGKAEVVQMVKTGYLRARAGGQVIFTQDQAADPELTRLFVMPVAAGTPKEIATFEAAEVRAMAGNATDLYLGVGSSHAGGLVRIKL